MNVPLPEPHAELTPERAADFVRISLECLHREYPNVVQHVMESGADVLTPRQMHPAFFGCFDWHSAVHNHWALIRLIRFFPDEPFVAPVVEAVSRSLTKENIVGELDYLSVPARVGFEIPYGMAWLLQLTAELREAAANETFAGWLAVLEPLERLARDRFADWLRKLPLPIRSGEHSQSAFALGLVWDWALTVDDRELGDLICQKGIQFHGGEAKWAFRFEPSAYDFLSPGLAAADLMRRIHSQAEFREWLKQFLPGDGDVPLEPVTCVDPSSGKLSHWDGLNLSRAWMLEGLAAAVPESSARAALRVQMRSHLLAGLPGVDGSFYAGAHWLVSFAVYLLTRRGLGGVSE